MSVTIWSVAASLPEATDLAIMVRHGVIPRQPWHGDERAAREFARQGSANTGRHLEAFPIPFVPKLVVEVDRRCPTSP